MNNQLEFEEEDFQNVSFNSPLEENNKNQSNQNNQSNQSNQTSALKDTLLLLKKLSCSSKNPIVGGFTIGFKILTMIIYILTSSYLFGSLFSFSTRFVVIILLVAIDFWIVKNISGRILVGLRYWNQIDENGESHWKFESKDDRNSIDSIDSMIFWVSLFTWPVFWLISTIIAIISLSFTSFLIIFFALAISLVNVYGYVRCLKDARQRITSTLMQLGAQGYMSYLSSRMNSNNT